MYPLPTRRSTHSLTDRIERAFYARVSPKERPKGYIFGDEEKPSADDGGGEGEKEKDVEAGSVDDGKDGKAVKAKGKKDQKKYDASLLHAIHSAFFWRWWSAGLMKLFAGEHAAVTLLWVQYSFCFLC